jgi:hypothetical protein
VDSALTRDEALRRFRADLTEPAAGLADGATARDELVQRFIRALEQRDTAALASLVITRAEFAYLYYPTDPLSRPPYELSPALMWFRLQGSNRKAAAALLAKRAGRPLGYVGYHCARSDRQGDNTVWSECTITRQIPGSAGALEERLFGTILERDGRYKLVALRNQL